jgi:hypothetical protein
MMPIPLVRAARVSALTACSAIATVGLVAGTVRILPWLLDPDVPLRVAAPFARGLAALALESAFVVGWPVGWALACVAFVERGEARVLLTLGERPAYTVRRLAPQGAALALMLAGVAAVSGADATEPGRVATELMSAARSSCAAAHVPSTYLVPFTSMTWLCAPGREPRVAGTLPGAMGRDVVITAKDARIAGDFRSIELDDARVGVGFGGVTSPVAVHAGVLFMHGMAPWAHASTLVPALRALLLAMSAWVASSLSAYGALRSWVRGRIGAIVLGAAGPVAALGLMRALERADAPALAFVAVPLAAAAAAALASLLFARAARFRSSSGRVLHRLRALRDWRA